MPRQYRLDKAFANLTGMLNGVYAIRDGVYTVPEGSKEDPKVLIEHYGAKLIEVSEPRKEEIKQEVKK